MRVRSVRPAQACHCQWTVSGSRGLGGGVVTEWDVLLHVAVELPHARRVRAEADHGLRGGQTHTHALEVQGLKHHVMRYHDMEGFT